MPRYGIIGFPLTHSFSPAFFAEKFRQQGLADYSYQTYPINSVGELLELVKNDPDLMGLNVTIPYKKEVVQLLSSCHQVVSKVGSCNCIRIDNGVMTGYNTDVIGFEKSLVPQLASQHTKALILGTGGSAAAVRYVLDKLDIVYLSASRNGIKNHTIAYDAITPDVMSAHKLIVNTTPLGMYPNAGDCPALPYGCITSQHYLFDLIYNPGETLFLQQGRERGATVKNGEEMLLIQAEESWKIWRT